MKIHVRKNDKVVVISGKEKASRTQAESAIVEKEAPINSSKVMIYCKKCKCGVRIGNQVLDDGSKVRLCKKCGETL